MILPLKKNNDMNTIDLTQKEKEVINQRFNKEFDMFTATDEQQKVYMSVIDKAERLMRELNAWEELGDSLIEWFWNKYNEQKEE